MNLALVILLAIGITALSTGAFFFFKQGEKRRVFKSFEMVLFSIMIPRYEIKEKEDTKRTDKMKIGEMEQVFSNFLSLKKPHFWDRLFESPERIALEVASQIGGTDILFFAAVPQKMASGFEKYVQGVYPEAMVSRVPEDYTIFEPNGVTAVSYLTLRGNPYLPLTTYNSLEKDPLLSITNALSKIFADEGAAIQIVIRPVNQSRWKKTGESIIKMMKEGKSLKESSSVIGTEGELKAIGKSLAPLVSNSQIEEKKEKEIVDEKTIQLISEKIKKPGFETNIRLVASAQTLARAEEILKHLESSFNQFSLSSQTSFEPIELKGGSLRKLTYDFSFRTLDKRKSFVLNTEELTSIYHLPLKGTAMASVRSVKSKEAEPPAELNEGGVCLIGESIFRGETRQVTFSGREDRRRHFYIIGQTGTGKTSLLQEMIRQDIQNGEGVAVIDPHGELVEDTLANIPPERAEDVVLFEPADIERPIGLNMLEYNTPEQKDFAVQEMISIFYKLFPPEIIGPMFEHYMRNAMLALMADSSNPGTLVEIPRIFTDDSFMEERLQQVKDPLVRNFWLKEWRQTTGSTKSDMLGYVVSKVGRFVENEMMRNIIGQSQSGINLEYVMDGQKIFLANLSKGLTGEVNSSLLGLILVSKMQMAAMRRASVPQESRKDFYLYIDEFQNFTTDSVATILSEARKYRLNLIIAHQYIPQLKEEIRNAVLGNVGTMAAFRVGADDAEFLEKQFEPEFSRFDLVNLDNFNLIVKMLINNKVSSPFKMRTIKPKSGNPILSDLIRKASRLKYGRPKELVEIEILKRSKIGV